MIEVQKAAEFRVIKTFEKKERAQEGLVLEGRTIFSGPLLTKETLKLKRIAHGDPEMMALLEGNDPLEKLGEIITTDAGYRFLSELCNMRLISGEPLTPDELTEVLATSDDVIDFLTVLTAGKTLEQVIEEQSAAQALEDDFDTGEDSPNAESQAETTFEDSSTGILTQDLSSPV